jgi:triphosphoribosyl-dephospho-CoA synthase
VGPTALEAVRRTRQVCRTNTNLGIVLLLAPLAAVPRDVALRAGIGGVLRDLTVADAEAAYEAIRLANPGGLGHAPEEDVRLPPTRTLREVMALAAPRDLVARQYANDFADVLGLGVPALAEGLRRDWPLEEVIVHCALRWLAERPDTLIARKRGPGEAREAARRASDVMLRGWPETPAGRAAFRELDEWLRAVGHERNPGTTADLVTASLFAALREGTMRLPADRPWASDRL